MKKKGFDFESICFLVRYGELGLKSNRVKNQFINILKNNIARAFVEKAEDCFIEVREGRLFIYPENYSSGVEILQKTFGVVSFSPVTQALTSQKEEIVSMGLEYGKRILEKGNSFAIRTRRVGEHIYTSMDVSRELGEAILDHSGLKELHVDLGRPDVTVFVEIRYNRTYFFHEKIPGQGGLPYGVSGNSICAIGNIPSLYSAFLMAKRGNKLHLYHTPDIYSTNLALEDITEFFRLLGIHSPIKTLGESERGGILRSLDEEGNKKNCNGIVLGFILEDFQQALDKGIVYPIKHPVYYPSISFSPENCAKWYDEILMKLGRGKCRCTGE